MTGNGKSIIEDILTSIGLESLTTEEKQEASKKKPSNAPASSFTRQRKLGLCRDRLINDRLNKRSRSCTCAPPNYYLISQRKFGIQYSKEPYFSKHVHPFTFKDIEPNSVSPVNKKH